MSNSDCAKAPKLQATKRHARRPSNFTSTVDLNDRINEILGSLPSKVHLTASNLQNLSESTKRLPRIKPFDLSPNGILGLKSVESSSSSACEVPSYARVSARRNNSSSPGHIKLYHLHRTDGQAPIKF